VVYGWDSSLKRFLMVRLYFCLVVSCDRGCFNVGGDVLAAIFATCQCVSGGFTKRRDSSDAKWRFFGFFECLKTDFCSFVSFYIRFLGLLFP
jgi:hypothetical protein